MSTRPLRLIQAGLGEWGRDWHAKILPQIPSAEVVAWAEPDAALRAQFPSAQTFPSLDDALARTDCDAVLITSSIVSHVPLIMAALSSGKHVLVEKPFASGLRDARKAVALATERGCVLMVSQNYRRFPAPEAVASLVERQELGNLESVTIRFAARMIYDDPAATHYMLEQPLLEAVAIHHLDLIRFVSGQNAVTIRCTPSQPPNSPFRKPPTARITLLLTNGTSVRYDGSVFSEEEKTPLSGHWTMRFTNGSCIWTSTGERDPTLADEKLVIQRNGREAKEITFTRPALYGRAALLRDFIRIVAGAPAPRSCSLGADNLHTLAMLEAAIRSAEEDREVTPQELLG